MNPDRLPELLRQRELVRTHLAWLDREIATASAANAATPAGTTNEPAAGASTPAAVAPAGLPPSAEFAATFAASPAGALYEPDPRSAALSAKRGCFAVFGLAVLLLALVLVAVYFIGYRDRPLLFAPRDHSMTEKPPAAPAPASPRK